MNQPKPSNSQETTPIASLSEIPALSYKVFFICLIGVTFANLDHSIFILVSEKFQSDFGWSLTDVGWYVALTFFISGLLCTQVGVLTDRIGRKKSLLLSTFLTPVFVAYLAIAPNTLAILIAIAFASPPVLAKRAISAQGCKSTNFSAR